MQLHVRMVGRDPEQGHRAATPLELFFDLTFVVAVAQGAEGSITVWSKATPATLS